MDNTVETIETGVLASVELTEQVSTVCPILPEWDDYAVTVRWTPAGETFEKWALHEYLQDYHGDEITQEELCECIHNDLRPAAVTGLSVTVADTKHMDMVVTKP